MTDKKSSTDPSTDDVPAAPARRGFLRQVVSAGSALPFAQGFVGGAVVAPLVANAADAPAATAAPAAPEPIVYLSFNQDEAAFVETMVNIMCPADSLTPSGVDCGLATYIDRQLAGEFGKGSRRYSRGPWAQGKPQLGIQLPLTPEQFFKAGIAVANEACAARFGGNSFDMVTPEQSDAFLNDLGAGKITSDAVPMAQWFNELVYPLFNQACYADPVYGGNKDKVFWKMIGYPGLPATNTINMVQFRGKPFPGAKDPKSMADFS